MNNNFRIHIRSVTDGNEQLHTALGQAVIGWVDEGEEEQEDEEFLLPPDGDQDDEDPEDDADADDDEDEADVPGRLNLQVKMTPAAFADCQALRQSDEVTIGIIYVDTQDTPVYRHEYTLDSMYLIQSEAARDETSLTLELTGLYTECTQFVPAEVVAVH